MDLKPQTNRIWEPTLNLGEGAMWHAQSGRFFFVDIHGKAIHAWHPESKAKQSWATPERVGWLVPSQDGVSFIAGFQSGFVRVWLDAELRIERMVSPHPGQPDMRLNDAKADPQGRIWAGSMNNIDPSRSDGQLARLDPDRRCTIVAKDIHIANGPAIAHDGSWMLHTDSYRNTVSRYTISAQGELSHATVWKVFGEAEGSPDGMTVDRDGNVWIAFWGGACIRQFTPPGDLIKTLELPAPNITNLCFGGEQLDILLVTSARNGLTAQELERYPLSGSVFALQVGVRGVAPCCYGA
jgi:xylono-1,5-lactonase